MQRLFKVSSKNHGSGSVLFEWQPNGSFLATSGKNGLVHIFDRQGEQYDEVALDTRSQVIALRWDADGSTLAIAQQDKTVIALWKLSTRTIQQLDTSLKDPPSYLCWNCSGSLLAIGTVKGNLVIYDKSSSRILPIVGKHSRRITCGAWNSQDQLVLGSDDRMMTLSNAKGDTIDQRELSQSALQIKFGRGRGEATEETLVAINTGKSILILYLLDPNHPLELTFQTYYGSVLYFEWFGDGLLIIVFSLGYLIEISTKLDEIGEEVFSGRFFSERIYAASYSPILNRTALSGDSGLKVVDMVTNTEIATDTIKLVEADENEANAMSFTSDGQILTVATHGGIVQNFLAKMPKIFDFYSKYIAFMSSLREISVVDVTGRDSMMQVAVSIEPSFVALGPRHIAVGINTEVHYYRCDGNFNELVEEKQYLGRVVQIKLNREYACVLYDGIAHLHRIEPSNSTKQARDNDRESQIFPGNNEDRSIHISSIDLTKEFFIYATSNGTGNIDFFYLQEWSALLGSSYHHVDGVGISLMAPNRAGTRVVFIDSRRRCYLLNSTTREVLYLPAIENSIQQILWDMSDPSVFITTQTNSFSLFHYTDSSVNGAEVTELGYLEVHDDGAVVIAPHETKISHDLAPILIYDGIVTCQHTSGKLETIVACSHDQIQKSQRSNPSIEQEKASFCQNLSLLRLEAAWQCAMRIDQRDYWLALAGRAMHTLNVSIAKRVYRKLGDAAMVMNLSRIEDVEEKSLLAGHLSLLLGAYMEAKRHFLNSTDPMAALEMQKHLLQWDQALKLADSLAVDMVPDLSLSYANQLEFRGEYEGALKMYEHVTNATDASGAMVVCSDIVRRKSIAGVARCTFHLGDVRRGFRILAEVDDPTTCRDCASILESIKQYTEAAQLYERGDQPEKAVLIYIQMKNLIKAAPLMEKVQTPKLHGQYGRAKEAAGDFQAASEAYEAANDMDNVVRIQLEHLNNIEKAFEIVRATKSSEGALSAAKYCTKAGYFPIAIEFLLLANKEDDAFQLAMTHHEVATFTQLLGEKISAERAGKVASYYETSTHKNPAVAANFYQICGNYHKAVRLYLQCGDAFVSKAIDVVGKARNDMLTHTLIDYLMGETDGIPKDPHHIFRLYMALGNYAQAAKTALIISRQEQDLGNYKVAHDVLLETYRQLTLYKIHVKQDLSHGLMLLHSYVLVKKLVKRNDHSTAARMLLRVAKHLSKFPTHASNILISTVIECQRAGLRAYSYEHAMILMRPEYRNSIDKEIRRKIEAIVRRPSKEQPSDPTSPCPYCQNEVLQDELDCSKCKNHIPYCIASGYHMVKQDWSVCPHCAMPAIFMQFEAHLKTESSCPMCESSVEAEAVLRVSENEIVAEGVDLPATTA
uniref:PREDICTED: similar to WD repeat domain 19 putative n=1 Tax=Albugo laibachii Nc14 TaxID=890382 RepID=F0W5W5_9STRA|nr:PREDICTED: similar to WD repeat domain 19 putative [Albugo laibachii Nc14]|eukprot:CCA16506.1 PREDICTED: similar to WD repeat domain 19 putative [Albugo laibachii Nc14]